MNTCAMDVTLRFATAGDAETLHRFIVELAEYEREPDAVRVTVHDLREQLERDRPPFECLLAQRGAEPCGFALFFHNYSTWRGKSGLYLEDLYVTPAARSQGIGVLLLSALARLAQDRDCARMEWAVLDWNAPAIGFYESLGATECTSWRTYRLTDAALTALAQRCPTSGGE